MIIVIGYVSEENKNRCTVGHICVRGTLNHKVILRVCFFTDTGQLVQKFKRTSLYVHKINKYQLNKNVIKLKKTNVHVHLDASDGDF